MFKRKSVNRSLAAKFFELPYPLKSSSDWGVYNSYGKNEDKIDVKEFLRQIRKHKWLIMSVVTIVTTLAAIQIFRTSPWYTATAVLEIGKENSMVLKSGDVTLNDDSHPQFLVNVNTKKLALDNPELFEKVVLDQKLDQNPKVLEIMNRKSLFSFLGSTDRVWYIANSSNSTVSYTQFGLATDKIVPADYDGDGKTDIAVFRPETGVWFIMKSRDGFSITKFGIDVDKPAPNAFVY